MRKGASLLLAVLLLGPAVAFADDADFDPLEPGRPFERGTFELSGSLGVTLRFRPTVGFNFTPAPIFGYYMLRGLELGFETDIEIDANSAGTMSFLPFLRYVIWRSYLASPYLIAQGGYRVILGKGSDPTTKDEKLAVDRQHEAQAGGGAGVILFGNRKFGIQFQASVFGLFPTVGSGDVCDRYGCVEAKFGVTLSYYFGGFAKGGERD
jgi:hypothetical protein